MPRARVMNPEAPLIQGVASPNYVVNPNLFYAATRRMRFPGVPGQSLALGSTDTAQLRQTGIISGLEVRVYGSVTFGGTIGTTTVSYEWPYNIVQNLKLSANGQSNLVSCRGITLRALEMTTNPKLDDSGLDQEFGGATVNTGTLAQPTDDWGTSSSNKMGPGSNIAATGTYTVDLTFFVPVAADPTSLIGSVFAQSSATNLTLEVQWATEAQLLSAVGGGATVSWSLNWSVTTIAYSIPNVNGSYVVPDLSLFHQLAETRFGGLVQGQNELLLPGTGVGRRLMRIFHNVYSNGAPVALNATNYNGPLGWAFGGSDTPESYPTGQDARVAGYRVSGVDLGGRWGIALHDFASQFALRDLVDEAATSDLRVFFTLASAPTSGYAQVTQETLFAAPVGA
jgi:hypothetical protein